MKRLISAITIIMILLTGIQVLAEGTDNLTYEKARDVMLKNNISIKKTADIEKQAYLKYRDSEEQAEALNTKGFYCGDMFISYDTYTQMLLTEQKELLPEQMKCVWETAQENSSILQNRLMVSLRDTYLGFVISDCDFKIQQSKVNLAEKLLKISKQKYSKGLVPSEDVDEADFNLLKAKKELSTAVRTRENGIRSLNSLIGAPLECSYGDIGYTENINSSKINTVDYYIEKALGERQEINEIQRDINTKQSELNIIEKDNVYLTYPAAAKERSDVLFDIETLKTKLEKARYDIKKEIKDAYIDVSKETGIIKSLKNSLDSQKSKLNKVTKQLSKGLITADAVEQLKIAVNQAENDYLCAIFRSNTALMNLENASGLGPAYSE